MNTHTEEKAAIVIDERITAFIRKQTCGSGATLGANGNPWCFTFIYSYDEKNGLLHYKSHDDTQHSLNLLANPVFAGTILPDKFSFLKIRGLQFTGEMLPFDHPLAEHASAHYHQHHPMSLAMPGKVWTVRVDEMKFTDNTLGFGTKLMWKR